MSDHDDPMLCSDRHSEIEQAMHIAAVKAMVAVSRGMTLDQFEERCPAPVVLDPYAGTGNLMVPRELLVDIWQYLWDLGLTPEAEALCERLAGVIA